MKSILCQDKKCTGGENCVICINRNVIAKEGYDLIRIIECVPASIEQTNAVNAAERFIKIAESAFLSAPVKEFEECLTKLEDSILKNCGRPRKGCAGGLQQTVVFLRG